MTLLKMKTYFSIFRTSYMSMTKTVPVVEFNNHAPPPRYGYDTYGDIILPLGNTGPQPGRKKPAVAAK